MFSSSKNVYFLSILAAIFFEEAMSSPIIKKSELGHESPCPEGWLNYSGLCLYRSEAKGFLPDEECPSLGARSVLNLFCVKESTTVPEKPSQCPRGWEPYHGHCIFLLDTNADTFCPLYGAVAVYNRLCVTDIKKEQVNKLEEQMKKEAETTHGHQNKEEERACCPHGFGK